MSVFSIEFGGPHSGFLIALLDAPAFGAATVFYYDADFPLNEFLQRQDTR